ncbi:MAG: ROK family protein [Candidatus Aenigmatarchaeota archaeon]
MNVGIDIGATKTRIGIEKDGKILIEEFYTPKENLINFLFQKLSNIKFEKIVIGIAGIVNIKKGEVIYSPNLKIKNLNLKDILEKIFKKEVIVVNDAIAASIGEKIYGKYKEKNFVYITISSGIGAGIFIDNKLILGKDGNAHEVGHITIDFNSRIKCSCGKYGHWEAYCSGNSIPNFVKYYANLKGYKIFDKIKGAEEFFKIYKKYEIGKEIFKLLQIINAKAIASIIHLYDPEIVVIGGSVAVNNKKLINKKLIKKELLVRMPKISFSKVKNNGVLGCLEICKNNLKLK